MTPPAWFSNRFAVAAAMTGSFDGGQAAATFCLLAIGGVAVGVAFGLLASTVIGWIAEAELSVTVSLLVAWGSYIGAERLHVSGVLSTVACGIVMGWRQHALLSAEIRLQTGAVWRTVIFVLESLVFILIGLSFQGILPRFLGTNVALRDFALQAAIVVAAVVLSRFAWILPTAYLVRAAMPGLRKRDPYPPLGALVVLGWVGMRGVVSLAAALALPNAFSGRDFLLVTTFAVILVTVVLQGSTLAPLIRLLRLRDIAGASAGSLSEREARLRMTAAELAAVKKHSRQPDGTERHPRLIEHYAFRLEAITRSSTTAGSHNPVRHEHFGAVLDATAAGRAELLRLHRTGAIDDKVLAELERELDTNEVLARHRGARRRIGERRSMLSAECGELSAKPGSCWMIMRSVVPDHGDPETRHSGRWFKDVHPVRVPRRQPFWRERKQITLRDCLDEEQERRDCEDNPPAQTDTGQGLVPRTREAFGAWRHDDVPSCRETLGGHGACCQGVLARNTDIALPQHVDASQAGALNVTRLQECDIHVARLQFGPDGPAVVEHLHHDPHAWRNIVDLSV